MKETKICKELTKKVCNHFKITKEDALLLYDAPLAELCSGADKIRRYFCGGSFDICTIINGKSGTCSENCKYCAQSSFHQTKTETYPLLNTEELVKQAKYNDERGVLRYSIVTSGKFLSNCEVDTLCESIREIKRQTAIEVCVSLGLLKEDAFRELKEAGVSRVHNNLETSRNNFPNVCTTHSYNDKIESIQAAKKAGLSVCSGGIMGLGESKEDRIDMAITLRDLDIRSVPINMLNPISGTPYENTACLTIDEMCRIVAVYRYILPLSSIRLAGGRGLMSDKGKACFQSGANAAISGDMLTTSGICIESDLKLIEELHYHKELWNE